jgi:hypothetical protein
VSTQLPPHAVVPLVHPADVHAPLSQTSPVAHFVPHAPQLFASTAVSTQSPPQSASPALHWHVPAAQLWPPVHVVPHVPQLAESDFRSTHDPPQADSPVPQDAAQTPLLHRGVVPTHFVPQPPQLFGSLLVSMHTPLQSAVPAGQTHLLALHSPLGSQAVVHEPQCETLLPVSTQAPLQSVSAEAHSVAH